MYKKITHNITEEHFDHPAATHLKAMVDYHTKPSAAETMAAANLRLESHRLLTRVMWHVRSYLLGTLANAEDLPATETLLFKDITDIGAVVSEFYGKAAGTEFDVLFKAFVASVLDMIKDAKDGRDVAAARAKITPHIAALASLLYTANPTYWPVAGVTTILSTIADGWEKQVVSRMKKMWTEDAAAVATVHDQLIGKRTANIPGFSDIFSHGIVSQFPEKFKA